jgi:TolB protein
MMMPRRWRPLALLQVLLLAGVALLHAGPNRYGHSERVERHMLPAVSTGPQEPAWSPDGRWIAFSMRGDIWKMPAAGGEAVALTSGPGYHFEPAWSPDGTQLAVSYDLSGNLDIGVVSADGGDVRRVTTDLQVDVQPAWSRDGKHLYFASARREGRFRIYRQALDDTAAVGVVSGIHPDVSPDGNELAYVASVQGRMGSGGLWVRSLVDTAAPPRLVLYEETAFRMKPSWTPDGQNILYVSDVMGSNDVAIIPAAGGNPIVLTIDMKWDEFTPSPSPDGTRFAFVSNRTGPTTLYTSELGGGPIANWTEPAIGSRKPVRTTGQIRFTVEGPDGRPMPARIYLSASDGRSYSPEGGFHRVSSATETHFFHTAGVSEVDVPAGGTVIEAVRGPEWKPARVTLDVPARGRVEATIRLERLVDMPAQSWYSGDTHGHDRHQGEFGLTHENFFNQVLAEDLHVYNALVHMDGTRLMGRWEDLTGKPHPLSTATHILQYGEEYRGGLGHLGIIGISKYILPFSPGVGPIAFSQPVLGATYVEAAHKQGGIAGPGHPFYSRITRPSGLSGSSLPVDYALGKGDFFDIAAMSSDEMYSVEAYYMFLNCGFRIAATGGTDSFGDVWRDPPLGADRTFVRVEGPLTLESWMAGIRSQRTFATTGPLVFLTAGGKQPGDELQVRGSQPVAVRIRAVSITPMDTVEFIVNGAVEKTVRATNPLKVDVEASVAIPMGGWIAARVRGPSTPYVTDSYAFAQTSPVYVVRDGRRFASATDARFMGEAVEALRTREQFTKWRSTADRDAFHKALDQAREVYRQIEQGNSTTQSRSQ